MTCCVNRLYQPSLVLITCYICKFCRLDADLLAHDVYEPGSQSLKDIVSEFGDDILSAEATIDRKKLGAIVFSDNTAMAVSLY